MVPSITANCPSPEAVKPLRPIILPPLCLTAWCLFLEWLYADEGIQLIDFRCVEAAMHLKVVGEQLLRSGLGHSLSTNGFFFQACIYLYLSKGHQSGKKRKIRKLKIKLIYSSDNFWLTNRIFKKSDLDLTKMLLSTPSLSVGASGASNFSRQQVELVEINWQTAACIAAAWQKCSSSPKNSDLNTEQSKHDHDRLTDVISEITLTLSI